MIIAEGYNSKPLEVKINGRSDGTVELWLQHPDMANGQETLTYMSANELLELFRIVKHAGNSIFGD